MSKSAAIRELASQGVPVAEIARRLNIKYQFAYNVIAKDGVPKVRSPSPEPAVKPLLPVALLLGSGFVRSGQWTAGLAMPTIEGDIPRAAGVYAFANDQAVLYVGVGTGSLAKRLYSYGKPGPTQSTNLRVQALIAEALAAGQTIQILTATPTDTEWNGLVVNVAVGLELGIIRSFTLPWNMRSAR